MSVCCRRGENLMSYVSLPQGPHSPVVLPQNNNNKINDNLSFIETSFVLGILYVFYL